MKPKFLYLPKLPLLLPCRLNNLALTANLFTRSMFFGKFENIILELR